MWNSMKYVWVFSLLHFLEWLPEGLCVNRTMLRGSGSFTTLQPIQLVFLKALVQCPLVDLTSNNLGWASRIAWTLAAAPQMTFVSTPPAGTDWVRATTGRQWRFINGTDFSLARANIPSVRSICLHQALIKSLVPGWISSSYLVIRPLHLEQPSTR